MNEMYLNHGCLMDATDDTLGMKLKELQEIILKLREQHWSLAVIRDFWNVPTNGKTLKEYMHSNYSKEKQLTSIIGIMNAGPYFELEQIRQTDTSLDIVPEIENKEFEYPFLFTCFLNEQKHIASFNQPNYLPQKQFAISLSDEELEVSNSIGLHGLEHTLLKLLSFQTITDVFEKIEENTSIIILGEARDSAKRHNFKGNYRGVYRLITLLYEMEFTKVSEEISESKEDVFYKMTGFKISPESSATMSHRRYRSEREFVIPGKGKEVFEWHIKIGHDTRIHYFVDKEEKKLYIGHCGAHLRTISFNS